MSQTFNEVFEEIKASIAVEDGKKKKRGFSRTEFNRLAKAFVNDHNFTSTRAKTKGGVMVEEEIMPVKEFRKMLETMLKDFGVDKQEAAAVLDTYEFKKFDGMYEFCSELIYQYMNTGKRFDFVPKVDWNTTLWIDEVEECESYHINPKDPKGPKKKVKKQKHRVTGKKSKCPAWLKETE